MLEKLERDTMSGKMIEIQDDFDLEKITSCGQCFRVKKYEDETYRFITEDHVLYIRKLPDNTYWISCSIKEWNQVWTDYFDLSRNYRNLRKIADGRNDFIEKAMEYGLGLRVLHQKPWEMLITFIISQRKNIPAISKSVEALAKNYGHTITTDFGTVSSFPTPKELSKASIEDLCSCSLGYRAAYVKDAVERVVSGRLDLEKIAEYEDEKLFQELMKVYGVGKKVANCVCLFGYGRSSRVPIDIWISRAIQEEFNGEDPFSAFGEDAGIIQQYVFYYKKNLL